MSYRSVKQKLFIEQLLMAPFVWLGKLYGALVPLQTKHGAVLFFSNADIGGAPQVNIDITECIKDKKPLIIFSKYPRNNQFSDRFTIEGARIIDLHKKIDNKLYHFVNFFYRGVIASWIRQQQIPVVLGGECLYFYKVIPHLPASVKRIEICHLDTWMNYTIGYIDDISTRIFSTEELKKKIEAQYKQNELPAQYFNRLLFIDNAIDIPIFDPIDNPVMQVYFIGRGAAQKRVHLIAAIATVIHKKGLPVQFNFVGDVENIVREADYPFCKFYGNVKDEALMKRIYQEADVLLMTSLFEGLPVVVMQMMAHGKTVVSTAVNGIPDYIHHNENGLLIQSQTEDEIISEGAGYIERLQANPELRTQLGKRSREIAMEKFSREVFCSTYRKLMFNE
ncbi:glycosyltransferase family 4 protein [Lacibacter sp. H407]|uniref:glycosyltransferase family 4 protein n=1 Tax=Lacibacter sp. H407 TaxID=3133423 RepID=UPI0030C3EEDF